MSRRRRVRGATVLAAILIWAMPTGARAQDEASLPTLESIGLGGWSTPNGFLQLALSGRADLEAYMPGADPAWLVESTDPFLTPRIRFFTDLFVGASWYATAELRADGGEAPAAGRLEGRVEQAFVRWAPFPFFALQAGRFASPFGSYPSRHHTDGDWFIRPPLMYEYRTMVSSMEVPLTSTQFIEWKDDPERFRPIGAPPVWAAPYQWGGMVFGVLRDLSWRAAIVNSAPSSEPPEWGWNGGEFDRANWVGALAWRFAPWLRVEASYSQGPYLQRAVLGPIPSGWDLADYEQFLWGLEALFEAAHTQIRAEAFHDRWVVPNVAEDPIDISWSVEARQKLHPDLFVAARLGQIRFNEIGYRGIGYDGVLVEGRDRWDYNVRRFQVAFGHRLARNAELRAEFMTNATQAPREPEDDLFSIQLWWAF